MEHDRRKFMTRALAAAPLFVPRSAWGANDRLAFGLIGAGGRGRYLTQNFLKLGAECVAIAEVYEPNTEAALKDAPQAKTYIDYHELLPQTGVDAVVVARPTTSTVRTCWRRWRRGRTSTSKSPCRTRSRRARR